MKRKYLDYGSAGSFIKDMEKTPITIGSTVTAVYLSVARNSDLRTHPHAHHGSEPVAARDIFRIQDNKAISTMKEISPPRPFCLLEMSNRLFAPLRGGDKGDPILAPERRGRLMSPLYEQYHENFFAFNDICSFERSASIATIHAKSYNSVLIETNMPGRGRGRGEEDLFDAKALTGIILDEMKRWGDIKKLPPQLVALLKALHEILEEHLTNYNKLHHDRIDQVHGSFRKKFSDYRDSVDRMKEEHKQEIRDAIGKGKYELDRVNQKADEDRAEFDEKKAKLERENKTVENQLKRALREARKAEEDKNEAYKLVDEYKQEVKEAKKEARKLKRELLENRDDLLRKASQMRALREEAETLSKKNEALQDQVKGAQKRADDYRRLSGNLGESLQAEKNNNEKLIRALEKSKIRLDDVESELKAYLDRSPTASTASGFTSRLRGALASDELGAADFGIRSETGSLSSSRPDSIEGRRTSPDYTQRVVHEQEMQEVEDTNTRRQSVVDNLKNKLAKEKNNIDNSKRDIEKLETMVATIQADHGKEGERPKNDRTVHQTTEDSKDDLIKKEDNDNKSIPEIETLEKKVATLEAEATSHLADIAQHIHQRHEREKELRTCKNRIADLEKVEQEQQGNTSGQQTSTEELMNQPVHERASASAQISLRVDDPEKKKLVKDLTKRVKTLQEQFEKAKQALQRYEPEASENADAPRATTFQNRDLETADSERVELIEGHKIEVTCLKNEIERLQESLRAARDDPSDDQDRDADKAEVIKGIRSLLRAQLATQAPSIADIDQFLMDFINLRKTIPGATPFEQGNMKADLDECTRERRRLEDENQRLNDDSKRIDERNKGFMTQIASLTNLIQGLQDEMKVLGRENEALAAQIAILTETIGELNLVIGNNGQQADHTREALSVLITKLEPAQEKLMETIANMPRLRGGAAAEANRMRDRAHREIEMFRDIIEGLTMERDQLADEVQACEAALRRAQHRMRIQVGGYPATAAAARASEGGMLPDTRKTLGGTYYPSQTLLINSWVWGTFMTLFIMMVAIIIAEGRLYGVWRHANAHTRALWMTIPDRPTICLGMPDFDYFWHTILMILSGRWPF
ncbi:hypothetical protein GGS21DRAFT_521891 [Xylaria nigripes]|nr:hypothetical protein GGS21DRAFT_521891 [Xylaria nigripes]